MSPLSDLGMDLVINSLSKVSVTLSDLILLNMASSKSVELFKVLSLDSSFCSYSVFTGTTITGA
jgi:ethanolamine utilization protein EutA (predicted chaperonin)